MPASTAGLIPPEAVTAYLALLEAQRDLAESGRRTPCEVDPEPWMAEDRATRAEAAEACRLAACPLLTACGAYAGAAGEKWGVWGGRDRETRPVRRKDAA